MSMIRGLLGVVLMTLVAGMAPATNWLDYRGDALNTGVSPDTITLPLRIRWQKHLPGWVSNIVVYNGVVYTASCSVVSSAPITIVAVDLATGTNKWTITTPDSGTAGTHVATDGTRLFVTGPDFVGLRAFNLSNGSLAWTNSIAGWMQEPPSINGGVLYAAGATSGICAIDPVTGNTLWLNTLAGNAYVKTTPIHAGADMFIGDGYSWEWSCLNQSTGQLKYSVSAPTYITMSPAYASGRIFGVVENGFIYALQASDLSTAWSKNIGYSRYSSPAVADGRVYVASETNKTLYCLNQSDGSQNWAAVLQGGVMHCGVTVAGGLAFVYDLSSHVYAIDRSSGSVAWSTTLSGTGGNYVFTEPVCVDGVLLTSDDGGGLIAFESATDVPPSVTPPEPKKKGTVKIVGGIRGYINPKRGEVANILVKPDSAGVIRVRIFSLAGDLVREITVDYKGTGTETIQWNGTDASGKHVPPAVYPVIVDAPGTYFKDKLAVVR
jgi:outer membrane protein assembly factor BamB